jgi:hypothetical protein
MAMPFPSGHALLDLLAKAPFSVRQPLLGTAYLLVPRRLSGLLPLALVTLRDLPRIKDTRYVPDPSMALERAGRVVRACRPHRRAGAAGGLPPRHVRDELQRSAQVVGAAPPHGAVLRPGAHREEHAPAAAQRQVHRSPSTGRSASVMRGLRRAAAGRHAADLDHAAHAGAVRGGARTRAMPIRSRSGRTTRTGRRAFSGWRSAACSSPNRNSTACATRRRSASRCSTGICRPGALPSTTASSRRAISPTAAWRR